jgi:hypothetical protein
LLRGILRSLFGGTSSKAAGTSLAPANSPEATAAAQKRLVAAILKLRFVVKSGNAEQIAAAIELFKARAIADDLEPSERLAEVAKAEQRLTALTTTATPVTRRRKQTLPPPAVTDDRDLTTLDIGTGRCNFSIVGEASYQGRLRNIATVDRSFTALLLPEPTNAYDPNAIRVVAEGGDTVGYFTKEDAVHYAPAFELLTQHGHIGACHAQLIGGTRDKRRFGVVLNLPELDELLTFLRDTFEPAAGADDQPF